MDNVNSISVIRQLLSWLPVDIHERLLFDRYAKKLTTMKAILLFIVAQLKQWSSYGEMELGLRAEPILQELLQLPEISGAQLSRKLDLIPTELLEWIFLHLVKQRKGNATLPPLHLLDSTTIALPLQRGAWARMSRTSSGVKMHLRLVVASPDEVYPNAMIPSSRKVDDREGALLLVVEADVIYVMDRGYDDYVRMDDWVNRGIRFVMRVRDRALATILEDYPVTENSKIIRDAKVAVGGAFRSMKNPVRLVEYVDDQGRLYRVFTSVWDKSAAEIAEMYKQRWLIELYFKWLKQHLRLTHVHSYKPQALWNQLFLVLITALLVDQVASSSHTVHTHWDILKMLRTYLFKSWSALEKELHRVASRTSRGRQPGHSPPIPSIRTTVGILASGKKKK